MRDKGIVSHRVDGASDGANPDEPSERLLSQLAADGSWAGSDLPCEMAYDLVLLLYTVSDFGELEWPLI